MDELNYVQIKPKQHIAYCICTKHREKEFSECCLSFEGTIVTNASFVKNIGIFFDRTLCMQKQASAITKSCYFQVRNIGRNRSYIRCVQNNSLLNYNVTFGLWQRFVVCRNANIISKLQRVQNIAARLITRRKKHDHITPVLMSLHWLPV